MTMAFAWVLVTLGNYNYVTYSPLLYDLESCQFLQQSIPKAEKINSKCIQIKVAK